MTGKLMSMKVRLKDVIDKWLDSEDDLPAVVGDDLAMIMADAAMAVLHGIVDAQEHLRNEGLLDE